MIAMEQANPMTGDTLVRADPNDDRPAATAAAEATPIAAKAELVLGFVLDTRCMLVFGRMAALPPAAAKVRCAAGGGDAAGDWRCFAWAPVGDGQEGMSPFVAALAVEQVFRAQAMPLELDVEESGAKLVLPPVQRIEIDSRALVAQLASAGAPMAQIYDFLKETLSDRAFGGDSTRNHQFMLTILAAISRHDGFLEILGGSEYGGLLVQGWSGHLRAGVIEVEIVTDHFEVRNLAVATFERADLLNTAKGIIGYSKDTSIRDLATLRTIHFRSGDEYLHLDVVNTQAIYLDNTASVAQLKDMMPKLDGPPPVLQALKRVVRPRFPGHETVSTFAEPVRIACDVALRLDGHGIFVSGWLLDPGQRVWLALLKSTATFYARLHPIWARLPRPDVSQGFEADPQIAPLMANTDHRHGFLAFVPRTTPVAADEHFYLELVTKDEACAFLPIAFAEDDPSLIVRRLLAGVSLDDPNLERIISQHLGPAVSALADRRAAPQTPCAPIAFGQPRPKPGLSVIMPVPPAYRDIDVNFACLATDPDFRAAELILVAASSGISAATLKAQAAFYGLSGKLVVTTDGMDAFEAMELGALNADAELLLFLSASVFSREPGWLSRLTAELARVECPGLVSPTLMYEDESIRFAGRRLDANAAPLPSSGRLAGYPADWLTERAPMAVAAAAPECCLVRRSLFEELKGFSRALVGPELKSLDFSLKVRGNGRTCTWVPDIRLYALDDGSETTEPDYWLRVGQMVDRWAFERQWRAPADTVPLLD
ncbi:MAG: hypothetical protein WAS73_16285 [Defluviicoccus sp.]